jgi:zearalenone synthase (nonreducing iterative type I polyketide synthase)
MLENGVIPPHPGLKSRLNPDLPPLADMHIEVPSESRAFKAARCGDARRRILINNFNATVSLLATKVGGN